jgi:hypothetical protein
MCGRPGVADDPINKGWSEMVKLVNSTKQGKSGGFTEKSTGHMYNVILRIKWL